MSSSTFRSESTRSFPVAQNHRFPNTHSQDFKVVVGIDLATTRCCLAIGKRATNDINQPVDVKLYSCWPASYETGSRWPITALLYDKHLLPKTGNSLEAAFKTPSSKTFDLNNHYREWKLLFHDNQKDPSARKTQEDLLRKLARSGKTRLNLLEDWVRVIYDELFTLQHDGRYELKGSSGSFDARQIEIVVTVPPGRSALAHDEVHGAFLQEPIERGQVFLVSEPEAMFRSWIHDGANPQDFKVGASYLVADGGGGTCCLVRFRLDKLEPLGFQQEFESESMVGGAESISNMFEEKIARYIPPDQHNRLWALDQLRRQFDNWYKSSFGDASDESDVTYSFTIPGSSEDILVPRAEITECFDQCVSRVNKAIHRQLQRGQKVEFLVLGGGLFNSPYVFDAVKKEFKGLKILTLSADKGHVARGAVLVKACAPFILRRPILRSKAVTTWLPITPEIKKLRRFSEMAVQTGPDGLSYCYAAQWLAKKGTEAKVNHASDMYEVASESSFKDARIRQFGRNEQDLTFSEIILTFNHSPPPAEEFAFQLADDSWVDMHGNYIPSPDTPERVTWSPQKLGIDANTLEIRSKDRVTLRILRYTLQMQMQEVGTRFFIKTWSWSAPAKQKGRVLIEWTSEADEREPVFNLQGVSQNLAASYRLGTGTQKGAGVEHHRSDAKNLSALSSSSSSVASIPTVPVQTHHKQLLGNSPSPMDSHGSLQREDTDNPSRYGVGDRRNNGGCWTCLFRKRNCDRHLPECVACGALGLSCEYGCPEWWYDTERRERQKDINKKLIKDSKARKGPKRRFAALSSESNSGPSSRSFVAPSSEFRSGIAASESPGIPPIPVRNQHRHTGSVNPKAMFQTLGLQENQKKRPRDDDHGSKRPFDPWEPSPREESSQLSSMVPDSGLARQAAGVIRKRYY